MTNIKHNKQNQQQQYKVIPNCDTVVFNSNSNSVKLANHAQSNSIISIQLDLNDDESDGHSSPHLVQKLHPPNTVDTTESTEDSDSERTSSNGSESPASHLSRNENLKCRPLKGITYIDTSYLSKLSKQLAREGSSATLSPDDTSPTPTYDPQTYDPSRPAESLPKAGVPVSYVNPKLEARTGQIGSGIFALTDIPFGEVLIVWCGKIITAQQALEVMKTPQRHYLLQVGEDSNKQGFYQMPLQPYPEAADWTNHSCSPSACFGANSPICLTAFRDIKAGEEITFDYCMCELDQRLWEPMECMCGSPECRKWITVEDHKLEYLWDKYDGFFSPHVQKRVDALRKEKWEQEEKEHQSSIKMQQKSENPFVSLTKRLSNNRFGNAALSFLDRSLAFIGLQRINKVVESESKFNENQSNANCRKTSANRIQQLILNEKSE